MRRGTVVLAILAAFILLASPLLPTARAESLPHLAIETFQVTPVDTNHDGLYDELQATARVNVLVGGNFRFQMSTCLGDASTGYAWVVANTDVRLGVGEQNVTALLPSGLMAKVCPAQGPYSVLLHVGPILTDGTFWVFTAAAVVTLPANVTLAQFEPAYARVSGPITDSGVDTDGDGLYDLLVVHVPLQVLARGRVAVEAEATAIPGYLPASVAASLPEPSRVLDPGRYVWDIAFAGADIRDLGRNGSLNVTITLVLDDLRPSVIWDRTWTFWHLTHAYLLNAFVGPPASVGPGVPSMANGSPALPYTEIDVPLQVRQEADYALWAQVGLGPSLGIQLLRFEHLTAGDRVVRLNVSKTSIARSGSGDLNLWVDVVRLNGSSWAPRGWSGDLGPWSPGDFALPPYVNVSITTNVPAFLGYPGVEAFDPEAKFVTASGYPPGGYQLSLYPGTFDVFALGSGSQGSFVGQVTVGPNTSNLSLSLTAGAAGATNVSLAIDGWNTTRVRTQFDDGRLSALSRAWADSYGDFDGVASVAEISLFEEWLLSEGGLSLPYRFLVDNVSVDPTATWVAGIQGAGSILSNEPLIVSVITLYADPFAPADGPAHRIEFETPYAGDVSNYADAWADYSVGVRLFDSAAVQRVTLASHMPVVDGAGFLFAPNATLLAAGPNAWSFQPGTRPANQSASNDLLFRIDATGPAYVQPHALPPSHPSALPPPVDLGLVAFGLSVVVLVAGLAVLAAVAERRRGPPGPNERTR